jgi:hypothetical protein
MIVRFCANIFSTSDCVVKLLSIPIRTIEILGTAKSLLSAARPFIIRAWRCVTSDVCTEQITPGEVRNRGTDICGTLSSFSTTFSFITFIILNATLASTQQSRHRRSVRIFLYHLSLRHTIKVRAWCSVDAAFIVNALAACAWACRSRRNQYLFVWAHVSGACALVLATAACVCCSSRQNTRVTLAQRGFVSINGRRGGVNINCNHAFRATPQGCDPELACHLLHATFTLLALSCGAPVRVRVKTGHPTGWALVGGTNTLLRTTCCYIIRCGIGHTLNALAEL